MFELSKRALGIAVVLGLCLAGAAARAEPKPIKIGVIQPMSGSLSSYAQEGEPVFEYMIRKINAQGGIKSMGGAKIEVILADDASQPSRTAAEARRLVSQHDVVLLTGTILSGQMLALVPVLEELKVPTLSMWAAGSRSPYVFAMGFPYDRGYAQTMADFAEWLVKEKGFKLKTAAMVYSNYEAGQQVNKYLVEHLKAKGFTVIGEVPLDVKAQDQTAALVRLRALKPDFTAGLLTTRDGQLFLKARHDLNYHDTLFIGGTSGFADVLLWRDLGPEVAGSVLTRSLFAMTSYSPATNVASVRAIIKEIEDAKILKTEVSQGAIQGAQVARMIQRVLEAAGSTDRDRILSALRQVSIPPGDPDLYLLKTGGLSFADDRLLKDGRAIMIQWTPDRRQEVIYPPAFANAAPRPFTK